MNQPITINQINPTGEYFDYGNGIADQLGPVGMVPLWLMNTGLSHGAIALYASIAIDMYLGNPSSRDDHAQRLGVTRRTVSKYVDELLVVGGLRYIERSAV